MHVHTYMWRSEDNVWELLFFYHVGPRHQAQVVRLGSKSLYLLSNLSGSVFNSDLA